MFDRFDATGDGVFTLIEFEMIFFTVLDIAFTKDQLRKLINLTDINKDGKIYVKEFYRMVYADEIKVNPAAAVMADDAFEVCEE